MAGARPGAPGGAPSPRERSILIVSSTKASKQRLDFENAEETEIAAQITVPHEGGWGWVVTAAAFTSIALLDGVAYTFGSLYNDLTQDINSTKSAVAFINSIAQAMYFIAAPMVSAFINRFGFRACLMTGSILVAFSLMCTYFSHSYTSILIFYGFLAGLGYCFTNFSSLVVGFYFERLRAIALSIMTIGSSVGISGFYPINAHIVKVAGWRSLVLLQVGLQSINYFLALTYRPLLSVTVTKSTDEPLDSCKTVTYLPSLKNIHPKFTETEEKEVVAATRAEKMLNAVSNINYPVAANVVNEEDVTATSTSVAGTSAQTSSPLNKYTVTAQTTPRGMSTLQLKQVKSIMTDANKRKLSLNTPKLTSKPRKLKKKSCWAKLCAWEEHVPQSRPMYRDDAFYNGKLQALPEYKKSVRDLSPESRTGLEYQLAVTRVASVADIQERRGIFTTAVRRILATMVDPTLLKRSSFKCMCFSGFLLYIGYSVPYVFLQDRNLELGLDPQHCSFFVSAIGFTNAIGKLIVGAAAYKFDCVKLYSGVIIISGISTILSDISETLAYQYIYCFLFGFFVAPTNNLRSLVLVKLYGLENLTNASGLLLAFQGFGCFICTPLASLMVDSFGYRVAFVTAGSIMLLSGLVLLPVQRFANKENAKT